MYRIPTASLPLRPSSRLLMQSLPLSTGAPAARSSSSKPTLPRLPVPNLHYTLQRYLKSLEPYLLEDAARSGPQFEQAYATRQKQADDFEHGLGRTCQGRLLALDRTSSHNWLDDNIWLKKAYHEWRYPLLIHSNWWLSFKNDLNVPRDVLLGTAKGQHIANTGITRWQVRRAAWLTHRVLDFKAQLERQEVYPDTTREGLWFRRTTSLIFNTSRIPQPSCDTISTVPPSTDPSARTILLSIRNWFYAIEVLDESLQLLSVRELERNILRAVKDVSRRLQEGQTAVPIPVLSADNRDRWTENLQHLLSISPLNQSTLNAINHSIFALSLDHYTCVLPTTFTSPNQPLPLPDTSEEVDAHLHNLRSSHRDHPAHNRWFDKPLTFIVESNTRAGALGEHSPCDALIPSIVAEYAVVQEVDEDEFDAPIGSGNLMVDDGMKGCKRLDWVTDAHIEQQCVEAEERARAIANDSDDSVLWFDAYGAEWIKKTTRLSPDAYIQMALQLAWYRTRKTFTATYETALTRIFHHGRTETIRTLSTHSRAFVLAMVDSSTTPQTRHAALLRAIQTHAGLTRAAATGKGIDRHLLGLRCMLKPGETHPLFEDELFTRSQTWKLSTSGLSAGHQFRGTGFGTPEADGYGINYLAGPDVIKFGIESKYSCSDTSTQGFKRAITEALLDMRSICLLAGVEAHL